MVKNIIWNSVGTFINLFCQWLMTILIVRFSGYGDAGILSLAMSIGSVMQILAVFGVKNYQVSDIKSDYDDSTYITTRLFTCIVTTIICLIWVIYSDYDLMESIAIFAYTSYLMVFSFVDVYYGIQQKQWRMDIIGLSMTIRSFAALIIFCLVILFTKSLIVAIFGMFVVSLIIAFVYDRRKTRKLSKYILVFEGKKNIQLLIRCLPIVVSGVMFTLAITIPRLFLEESFGREKLGIYASIAAPVMIIQVAASFVFNPLITKFAELYMIKKMKELTTLLVKCLLLILGLLIIGLVGATLFGDIGLLILFDEEILEYSYLLIPLVVIAVLTAISTLAGATSTVIRDYRGMILGGLVSIMVSGVLSIVLIDKYFMRGVNYVLCFALLSQVLVVFTSNWLKVRKEIGFNE